MERDEATKNQWLFCIILIGSLVLGSAFVKHMDYLLARNFSEVEKLDFIDCKEAAIINSLEMGIMPLFPMIGIGLFFKMPMRSILNICFKTFIIGIALGALIGTTYSMGVQYATSGFIH